MRTHDSLSLLQSSKAGSESLQVSTPPAPRADKAATAGIKHPMLLGFIAVVAVAHFLPQLARGFLPFGFGQVLNFLIVVGLPFGFALVMWKFNKQGWTYVECISCILFVIFTLMIGWWAFLIFIPIIAWMSWMTKA